MELNHPPLHWEPACQAENARLGPDGAMLLDYLLHPPSDVPPLAGLLPDAQCRDRQRALQALIDAAFA